MIPVVDAGRFVNGTNVKVGRIVATIVGGVLISYAAGWWQFFSMVSGLIGRFALRPIEVGTDLASEALSIPGELLSASWASAANWFAGPGAALGPFAYVLAILVTVLALLVLDWGLRQMGVLG